MEDGLGLSTETPLLVVIPTLALLRGAVMVRVFQDENVRASMEARR